MPDEKAAASLYQFLTPNANTMTALAAALIVPFAIEGIRKKRFTYPKWIGNAEGDDEVERRVDSVLERFDRRYRTKKRVSRSISQLIFLLGLTSFIYCWRLELSWTIFRFMTDMDMVPQYRLKGAWGRQNSGA